MRGLSRMALALLLAAGAAGCRSQYAARRPAQAAGEPPLVVGDDPVGGAVATPIAGRPVTVVDRHPLFSRPRDYYESTNGGKLAKTATATVIGVPAGLVGEIRQIVTGNPAPTVVAPVR